MYIYIYNNILIYTYIHISDYIHIYLYMADYDLGHLCRALQHLTAAPPLRGSRTISRLREAMPLPQEAEQAESLASGRASLAALGGSLNSDTCSFWEYYGDYLGI